MSELLCVGHAGFEDPQAEVPGAAAASAVVRVLANDDVVLGVGHQPEHQPGRVTHPGDVVDRPVRVRAAVPQGHLSGCVQADAGSGCT